MANRDKGEIDIQVDGTTYRLIMDINALIELEDLYSTPEKEVRFAELIPHLMRGSLRHIRAAVWASLRAHHPEMTVEDAGRLIQAAGGLAGFAQHLKQLMNTTGPDARDATELSGGARRPRKAQAGKRGTGENSSSPLAASA